MIYNAGDDAIYDAYDVDPDWEVPGSVNRKNHAPPRAPRRVSEQPGRRRSRSRDEVLAQLSPHGQADHPRQRLVRRPSSAPTFQLTTEPIERITPRGVCVVSGKEYEFDLLVLASGFRPNDFLWPMEIRGRHGRTLNDLWRADGARAYLGMMMPGFPNLWCLYGPKH